MTNFYRQALDAEAFGHIPLFEELDSRDEERLPIGQPRGDGVYWHMQDQVWRVHFNGADRFEVFTITEVAQADRLLADLKQERGY